MNQDICRKSYNVAARMKCTIINNIIFLTLHLDLYCNSIFCCCWCYSVVAAYCYHTHIFNGCFVLRRYVSNSERGPLNQVMVHVLPLILARCKQLLPDSSELSVTTQKQVRPNHILTMPIPLPLFLFPLII